eukprot:GILI01012383.1.p1 GENE.GILI01012383.1~~GILI01012383.1.p1  ORF type:complete len:320 (-),score=45.72 GILI01012383.1:110-1069(-)
MTHNLPVRSRDDFLFGNKNTPKPKDPEPTSEIQSAMDQLDPSLSGADDYKSVGNMCYAYGMFSAALRYYGKCIELEPDNYVHYSNRSAAYVNSILLSGPSLAYRDACKCVELNPSWFKGHLRKADALFAQDKLEEAIQSYSQVLALNKECAIAMDSRNECLKRQLMSGKESPPEQAPYAQGTHGQSYKNAEPAQKPAENPTEERTDELIRTWTQDTELNDNKTASKKYKGNLAEADREAGRQAKEAFMNRYKVKLDSDTQLSATVKASMEKEKLSGDGFDYRSSQQGQRTKTYANGTDEVGAAISADCYKSYTYKGSAW